MNRHTPRVSTCVAMAFSLVVTTGVTFADNTAQRQIGFLAAEASADSLGPEGQAAYKLSQELGTTTYVVPAADGKFVDAQGNAVALDTFDVVWFHQGDSSAQDTAVHRADSIAALRAYTEGGGGLYLSGAALAIVHAMGIEPVQPRLGEGGEGAFAAGLLPTVEGHPVFQGLARQGIDLPASAGGNARDSSVPINDAGYPAFADFHGSGGPRGGMLLARASASSENPLVEYELGSGRVIALGWRVPRYNHPNNPHRANLERLTNNVLAYLADAKLWRPVVVDAAPAPTVSTSSQPSPGVPDEQWTALSLAVTDLIASFGQRYPNGRDYLARLETLRRSQEELLGELPTGGEPLDEIVREFNELKQEALLANPLLDFDRLLVIERSPSKMGLPANWQSNSSLPMTGFDNRLAVLSPLHPDGQLTTLHQPANGGFIGDVDLHFDAQRLLFSAPGANGRWQVVEMNTDGSNVHEIPLILEPDVDNYDACYLPDGRLAFTSTAPFVGVPCVYGSSHVTNLYLRELDGSIRQLTVDQEHNWCPSVTTGGRLLYLRWEYSDLPHSNSRILFHMNPDGAGQMEYYGSNSFFPNSLFYARSVPGHPTKVVGVITGHHGVARAGRLLIFDPALGRHEADGVAQEIPGRGKKVEATILDPLVDGVWPQFLHPYPLSENYYLVSAKLSPSQAWGIYLVDVFDNILLLKESPGYALLEPIPLKKQPTPPVIQDRVVPGRKDATVYLTDVHAGPGLEGIPRGTVKQLRLFTYQFSYRNMGGLLGAVGMDGPWDVKRVLGTVPVEADGSALFRVPANTPVAVQPLDEDGQALQIMRSWFTAMPGEVVSCVGCHDEQNTVTPNRQTIAGRRRPSEVEPWYGPTRGFSFAREVQPVLDEYCVACHDGQSYEHGDALADLRGDEIIADWMSGIAGHVNPSVGGKFSISYGELHRYVRRPGIESNIRLLVPMEFHAGTTELVQMLRKGHHGVVMDREAWDRIVTWIDLNAPYHGTWGEIVGQDVVETVARRAREMRLRYAGMDDDPEVIFEPSTEPVVAIRPARVKETHVPTPDCSGWPFDATEARRRQTALGETEQTVDLGAGLSLELVRIPAGQFVMGSADGHPDERPRSVVSIEQPFWLGRFEVTNQQFARFDPGHDSRVEPMHGYQFGIHGYPVNQPRQPAVRLSWRQALDFCDWLSQRTGRRFTLPNEAQWEYACRAGTDTPMSYGDLDTDFSSLANLGDAKLSEFALDTFVTVHLVSNPNRYDDWVPKEARFNDGGFVSTEVGRYRPNAWGLHDMHGNVWEWTASASRAYPYVASDGRNEFSPPGRRIVRGGSWYDRPLRCRSSYRLAYPAYQRPFNVGFRVVME